MKERTRRMAMAGLGILAAGLFAAAVGRGSDGGAYPGWQPVNRQLAAALGEISGGAAPAGEREEAGGPHRNGPDGTAGGAARNGPNGQAGGAVQNGAVGPAGGAAESEADRPTGGTAPAGSVNPAPSAGTAGGNASPDGDSSGAGTAAPTDSALPEEGRIDINRATAEELDALPGIGPAKARAIVEERKRGGPFRSAEDLTRVRGIGPKLAERLRDAVSAGP